MKVHIVTGLPGSGKTTYCQGQVKPGSLVYDLDSIAAALDYGRGTQVARRTANSMIEPFIIAGSCENAKHLYIIRTSPSIEEQELFARYKADYIELDHIWEKRDINDEEWDRIVVRHEMYIKRIRPRIENAEKW